MAQAQNAILGCVLGAALVLEARADITAHLRTTPAGEYRITYWTSGQGLPQNTVTCLLQTRDGYLWVGTRYGLARYDGVRFKDLSAQLADRDEGDLNVQGLAQDGAGRLWVHTLNGLACYQGGRFAHCSLFSGTNDEPIQRIHAAQRGDPFPGGI